MAARKVGHKKGFKRPRKPPLRVLSDFGTPGNTPFSRTSAGIDKRLNSAKTKGTKEYYGKK